MRAQDPLTELGLTLGGHRKEDAFWRGDAAVRSPSGFGVDAKPETTVVCVDGGVSGRGPGTCGTPPRSSRGIHTATSPFRKKT